jgi:hypothetical protein
MLSIKEKKKKNNWVEDKPRKLKGNILHVFFWGGKVAGCGPFVLHELLERK